MKKKNSIELCCPVKPGICNCVREKCAWWIEADECCAVVTISDGLNNLQNLVEDKVKE